MIKEFIGTIIGLLWVLIWFMLPVWLITIMIRSIFGW